MPAAKRILTVFGTRPEAIKLFPLVRALEADPRFVSRTCVTGQHRALLDQVLKISGVVPDIDLDLLRANESLDDLAAHLLTAIGGALDLERPDWVVVQGDTATAMSAAFAAYYRRIPVCHVEAGLRSGNIYHPWPEEVNRKVISAIAALHCAPTQEARAALLAEGTDPGIVHVTGNTVIDALQWMVARIEAEPALAAALAPLEERFAQKRIVGVTAHRRENWGEGMAAIAEAIRRLAARPEVAVIFPLHANPQVRRQMEAALDGVDDVALIEALDYPGFVRLLAISHLVLTDSGGVQEEAPALGTPALVMRETTERPEGIEAGTALLVGTDADRIVAEANRLLDDQDAYAAMARTASPFGDGHAAPRICDLICEHS